MKLVERSLKSLLSAKLYSYKMLKGKEENKCKGVKKSVVKEITHDY